MNSPPQMDKLVLQGWRDGRCPIVDGVVFADGRIALLRVTTSPVPGAQYPERIFAYRAQKDRVTSIGDLERQGALEWTHIYRQVGSADESRNLRAWYGETSWGSEGFVALATVSTDQPIWIAIFDGSNPFKSATLTATTVEAVSTHENVWSFPIDAPEDVSVD